MVEVAQCQTVQAHRPFGIDKPRQQHRIGERLRFLEIEESVEESEIELEIVAEEAFFQKNLESSFRIVEGNLPADTQIVVGDRHIVGPVLFETEAETDQCSVFGVERVGLRVDRHRCLVIDPLQQVEKRFGVVDEHRFEARVFRSGCGFRSGDILLFETPKDVAHLISFEFVANFEQRVAGRHSKRRQIAVVEDVVSQRDELPAPIGILFVFDQQVSDALRFHLVDMFVDAVERTELCEQFHGGFGADAGNTRHVVGAVADERLVIGELFRMDAVLLHARLLVDFDLFDRIEQHDMLIVDQLVEILVVTDDAYFDSLFSGTFDHRGDDVVRFVVVEAQFRQPHLFDPFDRHGKLLFQLFGRFGTLRFVVRVDLLAETGAWRVEGEKKIIGRILFFEIVDQIGEAGQKPCRESIGVFKGWKSVEASEKEAKGIDDGQCFHNRNDTKRGLTTHPAPFGRQGGLCVPAFGEILHGFRERFVRKTRFECKIDRPFSALFAQGRPDVDRL